MAAVASPPPPASPTFPSQRSSAMSAVSYTTAPLADSASGSRDSLHTVHPYGLASPGVNPMHVLSQGLTKNGGVGSVHVQKVSEDKVAFTTGEPDGLLRKAGNAVVRAVGHVHAGHPSTADAYRALPKVVSETEQLSRLSPSIPQANPTGDYGQGQFTPPPSPPASVGPNDENAEALSRSTPQLKFTTRLTEEPSEGSELSLNMIKARDFAPVPALAPPPPIPTTESSSLRPASLPARAGASVDGVVRIHSPDSSKLSQSAGASTSAAHRPSQLTRAISDFADLSPAPPDAASIPMQMASTTLPRQGDGLLHPSSAAAITAPGSPRGPTRRNTTGSSALAPMHRSPRPPPAAVSAIPPSSFGAYCFEDGKAGSNGALDSDILKEAEQIRRERVKRALAQQEAEANAKVEGGAGLSTGHGYGHARKTSLSGKSSKEANSNVLVGNLIGEDHVNYVLMYNMLTGIRIAVSRCQAKIKRPLTDDDFTARHKFSFDIIGNELTPSAKYDFKFKDYAPWVFRELREDYFRIDPSDYLVSLTAKYILSELGSPGKSGSFFYFSRDYRFIIKTIHHTEHKFLRKIIKDYYMHVKTNPHTLISRFYGLHRVKLPRGRKIHFVIMNNLFPPHRDIHETYDLKGSTVGREYPEAKAADNPRAVLKDLNWLNRGRVLELGPEKRAYLFEQLKRDSDLLKRLNVMDYSLLVGIHNMQRGNRDNVRRNTLRVFDPDVAPTRRSPSQTHHKPDPRSEATAMRRAMRQSDPKELAPETHLLPETSQDLDHFIFYQDEGGYRATDESNRPMDTIYYLGIIDTLTPYTVFKRLEHLWKGMSADRHKISPVPAVEYGNRFFDFLTAVTRGGGGGQRFRAE